MEFGLVSFQKIIPLYTGAFVEEMERGRAWVLYAFALLVLIVARVLFWVKMGYL
jgi:hypothetical protein